MTGVSLPVDHVGTGAYGLPMPTWRDVRDSLERIYGAAGTAVWQRLAHEAGIVEHDHGRESSDQRRKSLERMLTAMEADGDPVVALCGLAVAIRLVSYDHLSAVQAAIRRSQS